MVQINAQVPLSYGGKEVAQEFAQTVTAIASSADDDEATLSPDIQRDAALVQSGDSGKSNQLANELLESASEGALNMAVRLFDNTERTGALWTVIENSPYQQMALDLMLVRLKNPDFVPDYNLLLNITGIKARIDKPLEFAASDAAYPEYHPDLEDASVTYFRSLLNSLVDSTEDPQSPRAMALSEISSSIAQGDRCPLGTYGLSSSEAAAIKLKLSHE